METRCSRSGLHVHEDAGGSGGAVVFPRTRRQPALPLHTQTLGSGFTYTEWLLGRGSKDPVPSEAAPTTNCSSEVGERAGFADFTVPHGPQPLMQRRTLPDQASGQALVCTLHSPCGCVDRGGAEGTFQGVGRGAGGVRVEQRD